ncbi:MAG: SpoIID/LytB domain-containing protein [Lachnospiraceae bacterium]|nr:SpoIID/LytB domain-containing protein [Lachnospiraceae bacterium]
MNLFRIVQKRTNKSKREESPYRNVSAILLFVFLLPYVVSCLWGHIGEETETFINEVEEKDWIDRRYEVSLSENWGIKRMNMQEYLIRKLEIIMPQEEGSDLQYELEALKAQAVLLRTELWRLFIVNSYSVVIQDDVTMYNQDETIAVDEETLYEKAVRETDGIYLAYDGQPVKAAFFPVSSGHTRAAKEVWENSEYPYLISVECDQDIQADNYQSQTSVSKEEYCRLVQELFEAEGTVQDMWVAPEFTYDSAGYVIEADFYGHTCSGETFRNKFGLNSACFQMQWMDESVVFHVKGVGHGFGMSQYGANRKAVSGENFDQILEDYFFNTELAKIE